MEPVSPPHSPRRGTLAPSQGSIGSLQDAVDHVQATVQVSLPLGNVSPLASHTVSASADPSKSQGVAHTVLTQTSLETNSLNSGHFSPFDQAFESFRKHLVGLANPYAVSLVVEILERFCKHPLDVSNEKGILAQYEEPKLAPDTKQLFKDFLTQLIRHAQTLRNPQTQAKFINDAKKELREFTENLRKNNLPVLEEFASWEELETLFEIPGFLALRDRDYKKLLGLIRKEGVDQVRDFVDDLDRVAPLKDQAEEDLRAMGYTHDLDTLLSEVCEKKPRKKEGIRIYWNRAQDYFTNKTLYLAVPNGESHSGTIRRCERTQVGGFIFHLYDLSEIHISPEGNVTVVTTHVTQKLFSALQHGSFAQGDVFTIEHASYTDNKHTILPGQYMLRNPREVTPGLTNLLGHYFECNLVHPQTLKTLYYLRGDYTKDKIPKVKIERKNPESAAIEISVHLFEHIHKGIKQERRVIEAVHQSNLDLCVFIKDEPNEETLKLQKLENIKKERESICFEIQKNRPLLDNLLDDLVKQGLKGVDYGILGKLATELAISIQALSDKYSRELDMQLTPGKILKQLVLEANSEAKVDKKSNIVNARTIELLTEAYTHIEKMQGKEVTLVMGNTGSGKSTAIGFLMGAELEAFTNQVGDKVVRHKKHTRALTAPATVYPVIGQSIGMSETKYPQGFLLAEGFILVDCPGFNDTRGGEHVLCTNLSLDKAVELTKGIRSIVVAIPANAFLMDKGNPVIELMNTVQDRFPNAFHPEGTPKVYLLITKQNQIGGETARKLKDGIRFQELINDTNREIKACKDRGVEFENFEIPALTRRLLVWQTLQRMLGTGHIHFIDTRNQKQREELVKRYSTRPVNPSKGLYMPAMEGDYMQKNFADCVQSSTHTWCQNILGPYLNTVADVWTPTKKIEHSQQELKRKKAELENLKKNKAQRLDEARTVLMQIQAQEAFVELLNKSHPDARSALEKLNRENIDQKKKLLSAMESRMNEMQRELSQLNDKLKQFELSYIRADNAKEKKEALLEKLKEGTKEKELFEKSFQPDQKIEKKVWKSEAAIDAALKGLTKKEDYFEDKKYPAVAASEFEGVTADLAIIQKGYRLIPSDSVQRANFIQSKQGGGYTAKITGHNFRIDQDCRYLEDGKTIGYGFNLTFKKGERLPWIKITFSIPNSEYNAAAITDLESEIIEHEKAMNYAVDNLMAEETPKIELEKGIASVISSMETLALEVEKIEKTPLEQQMQEWKVDIQTWIEKKTLEKRQLEDVQGLDEKIQRVENDVASEVVVLETHKKERRNLAILIVTQWENARLLRKFADFVLGSENKPSDNSEVAKRCREFIEIFDKHKDSLLSQIKIEHGF